MSNPFGDEDHTRKVYAADTSSARLVWITREQTNALARILVDYDQRGIYNPMLTMPCGDILNAWDAAPADPAQAIAAAFHDEGFEEVDTWEGAAKVALRALGAPDE